ncbi:MAG: PilZ domain-containing protein [Pseudomonadota bacterium]
MTAPVDTVANRQAARMQSVLRGRGDTHGAMPTQELPDAVLAKLVGAPTSGDEQRFAKRRQTKMKAFVLRGSTKPPLTCTVRDISSTGVLIHLPVDAVSVSRAGEEVTPRFTLQMPLERIEVDCELAWRQAHRIGARFVSATRMLAPQERRVVRPKEEPKSGATALVGKLFSR